MPKNHKKEQFIAIFTLASVFALFIFLKINPETDIANSDANAIESIVQEKVKRIKINKIETNISEEILINDEENNSDIEYTNLETNNIIVSYTDRELKRAQSYLQKDWKADDTINSAAWEYVKMSMDNQTSLTQNKKNKEEKDNSNQVVNNSN